MYNKRTIGTQKEQLAADYLKKSGYIILEQNFSCRTGEIDIIAKEENYLIFVEVKYRKDTAKGFPQEAVDFYKMKKITHTALYYMTIKRIPTDTPCRFDVVNILDQEISLIQNAFEAVY
ncbi:YraN family protein [Anaerocolumna sp. MB42-C2]|uniref:YraN family protein n=1 Tax=Anaerocolumna sp. MB42-C2 TaxID=3070997 RepID=UPI0027DFF8F5|nr:YraN family protein [Anaerocolumna sp. MB42-C2]WMJ88286.1 YraN family protein [Anaerocolumna sp. MB42-C2]